MRDGGEEKESGEELEIWNFRTVENHKISTR